jgi:hypothetical protein
MGPALWWVVFIRREHRLRGDNKFRSTTKLVRDDYDNAADPDLTVVHSAIIQMNWKWTTSKATAKCDINNAMFHSTTSATQKWLILGGDRFAQTGTAYIDFQFSQGHIYQDCNRV